MEENKKEKKTFAEIISSVKLVTVEPSAFFMFFASGIASLASQTLNLDKTCRVNLKLEEELCDAVRYQSSLNNTENEKLVQEYVAEQLVWQSALQTVLPCLIYPFVGGWLDLTGRRKLFMILPIVGELLGNISTVINVVFFYQLPVQILMFCEVFFSSLTGGLTVISLAMVSYITDVTNENNRTHRLGLLSLFIRIAMPAGSAISGVILKLYGYYAIYFTSISIHILNLCYVIFYLSDPPRSPEKRQHDGRGLCYALKTFFNPNHLKNTLRVFCRKTNDNRFLRLILLVFCVFMFFGTLLGEMSILYLSTRYRFNWDELKFSIFQTYTFIIGSSGTVISLVIFAKLLHWHDAVLGLIACASKVAGSFVFCFAVTEAVFYIAPVVDMFSFTALIVLKSILTKQVDHDEVGKVNSVLGLFENLMPFVYVSMYTQTYAATMEVLPGAVFLLGAALTLPTASLLIWLLVRHRKGLKREMVELNDYNGNELKL